MVNIQKLILSFILVIFVAFAGSAVTTPSIATWYSELNKPSFNPPNFIFGPVWTILYILMAVSFYLVLSKKRTKLHKNAIIFFLAQLFLNFLWSLTFFGGHNIFLAFIVIVLLWLSILRTVFIFYKIDKTAAYLLIPYILWVSFAAILNFSLYILN